MEFVYFRQNSYGIQQEVHGKRLFFLKEKKVYDIERNRWIWCKRHVASIFLRCYVQIAMFLFSNNTHIQNIQKNLLS